MIVKRWSCRPDPTELHREDLPGPPSLGCSQTCLIPFFCSKALREQWAEGRGWLTESGPCHEWIYRGGDDGGRRLNWRVTHIQPSYLAPAKLGCIRWLVIGPDFANVSYSRTSRQLAFIRAWPGLPSPAAPPPLCPLPLLLTVLTAWPVGRKLEALLTRLVHSPLLLLGSMLKFLQQVWATRQLVCGQLARKTTSDCAKRENVILFSGADRGDPPNRSELTSSRAAEFSLSHTFRWSSVEALR